VRYFYWPVIAIAAIVFGDFAVGNLDHVTVTLWPFGEFSTRLYLVVLLALLAGFLIGLLVAWIWSWGARRAARERARRITELEHNLAAAEQRVKSTAGVVPHS
jgi:uncharacterized integral membrane protein